MLLQLNISNWWIRETSTMMKIVEETENTANVYNFNNLVVKVVSKLPGIFTQFLGHINMICFLFLP